MAEFPEDVMIAAREATAKAWAEAGQDLQREFRSGMRDDSGSVQSAAEAIMAERRRPVVVVCENDFPSAVFSSTAKAAEWTDGAKAKDKTSPFATRIYRHHHSFVVDSNLKNTAD